jgi:hypothetical protein
VVDGYPVEIKSLGTLDVVMIGGDTLVPCTTPVVFVSSCGMFAPTSVPSVAALL